jgi:hypothetical protein
MRRFERLRRSAFTIYSRIVLIFAWAWVAVAFAFGTRMVTFGYAIAVAIVATLSWIIIRTDRRNQAGHGDWEIRYREAITRPLPTGPAEIEPIGVLPVERHGVHRRS